MSPALEVRERPILFSGEMVRAILEGRKTQTRRLGGLSRINEHPDKWEFDRWQDGYRDGRRRAVFICDGAPLGIACPSGQPGDRLWVRETWAGWALNGGGDLWRIEYPADGGFRDLYPPEDWTPPRVLSEPMLPRRAPSIHMPRWASRITLEITDLRVQRLQEISAADACDEGAANLLHPDHPHRADVFRERGKWIGRERYAGAIDAFAWLWDSINGAGSWDANPWVWVLGFRRVAGGAS